MSSTTMVLNRNLSFLDTATGSSSPIGTMRTTGTFSDVTLPDAGVMFSLCCVLLSVAISLYFSVS